MAILTNIHPDNPCVQSIDELIGTDQPQEAIALLNSYIDRFPDLQIHRRELALMAGRNTRVEKHYLRLKMLDYADYDRIKNQIAEALGQLAEIICAIVGLQGADSPGPRLDRFEPDRKIGGKMPESSPPTLPREILIAALRDRLRDHFSDQPYLLEGHTEAIEPTDARYHPEEGYLGGVVDMYTDFDLGDLSGATSFGDLGDQLDESEDTRDEPDHPEGLGFD
ncbi:MAG: hypothetical protein KDC54_04515 [Lewinella sp.]|nr:hypothetical protein [Lewinella sp.]